MANGNQDNANPVPEGPGGEPVSARWIIFTAIYMVALTVLIFFGIWMKMPTCEPNQNSNTAGSSNQNNANAGAANNQNNANAGAAGNQSNANVNVAGNQNTAVNPANQNDNQNANQNAGTAPSPITTSPVTSLPVASPTPIPLKILSVSPASGPIDGETLVTIRGTGLNNPKQVIFGGVPVKSVVAASNEGITIQTSPHVSEKVDVAVIGTDGRSDVLQTAFTYTCRPLDNDNLFLMVLLAGALGALLHAMRSFFWYVGNRVFIKSWTLMYILLPFTGAMMASVFFLIILAGLLNPNSATNRETYWFVLAIAVLTGLFSQQAALKLQNIINAALTMPGEGKDSKPQETQSTGANRNTPDNPEPKPQIDPNHGPKTGGVDVTISGIKSKTIEKLFFGTDEIAKDQFTFESDKGVVKFKTPSHDVAEDVEVKVLADANKTYTVKYKCE